MSTLHRESPTIATPPDSGSLEPDVSRSPAAPSPASPTTSHQIALLEELNRLIEERSQAEVLVETSLLSRQRAAEAQNEADRERLAVKYQRDREQRESEYEQAVAGAHRRFDSETHKLGYAQAQFAQKSAAEYERRMAAAKQAWQTARQRATGACETEMEAPRQELAALTQECETRWAQIAELDEQVRKSLRRRGLDEELATLPRPGRADGNPLESFAAALARGKHVAGHLASPAAAKAISWVALIVVFLVAMLVLVILGAGLMESAGFKLSEDDPTAIGILLSGTGILSLAASLLYRLAIAPLARRQVLKAVPHYQQARADGRAALDTGLARLRTKVENLQTSAAQRRDQIIADADTKWAQQQQQLSSGYDAEIRKVEQQLRERRQTVQEEREQSVAEADTRFPQLLSALDQQFENDSVQLRERLETRLAGSRRVYEEKWGELAESWRSGFGRFTTSIADMNRYCDDRFPDWGCIRWSDWQPPRAVPGAVRFGEYAFGLEAHEGGIPRDARLRPDQTRFSIPAVLSYPECPSLLLETYGDGRQRAVATLQNVMLRLLTALPAGKVRFTILDPVGLGENFSAFMHLADFDERLVTNRIWTESAHIQQRLTDLTEHMEKVIQKYLRNEFSSIQQYNDFAGEVAEPFQVLVVANFPAGFSDETVRRLVSIATSGARCGVYVLASVDMRMKLPRNFELTDLEKSAATLSWTGERFAWKDPRLARHPIVLDEPPPDEIFTQAVRAAGEQAKDANRVEVPFSVVAALDGAWWEGDSRSGIQIALGRAGATKHQYMRLGRGTSQHVLVAGKTGSGKSTLMHALVTNLAIHYSPREVQFYLIDFKKGVEFKPYATFSLPHARVIAIESEREFGMSVLERLDLELKRRGDLFRDHGVQDVQGFRDANPEATLPRILLIIDEFQELFVQDDKIANDAALLLDRLVRQGRAFGIHVLLGSQTLSGAYSLARSTLGQMAVRVALQCSETDAHLILSEENTAARLLGRPGEAIYNDANGLLEGNHPFQVVWLPDHERERYLRRIGQLADERGMRDSWPIVFEGNVPADPSRNELLGQRWVSPTAVDSSPPTAWLGAAVAIKDPTAAYFRRQSGSNLLLVGQHEDLAFGVLANSLISLLATLPGTKASGEESSARFYVLDGARTEQADDGGWPRLARLLSKSITVVEPRDAARAIAGICQEVLQRVESGIVDAPPIFVLISNLARFRDLKKGEDFSFSSFSETAAPAADKQLATILREGPSHGVHALIWCDSPSNLSRWLDRPALRDLEMRVLFQMSPADSSNLMDSPAASRLGINRAILYREDQGDAEKFRPYGPPSLAWLEQVKAHLENGLT